MPFISFNGKILSADAPIIGAANRGLRFGDGVFETMKFVGGKIRFIESHLSRLSRGLSLLKFDLPKHFSLQSLEEQMFSLAKKNAHQTARIRLTAFRGDGGLYDPETHSPNWLIETFELQEGIGAFNENGLDIGIYPDARKSIDAFANIKQNNFLPYSMAALWAKDNQLNDALVLNSAGNVCDSTIANVFIIKDERILTPALTEGCIAGVFRGELMNAVRGTAFEIDETAITVEHLLAADEVFLTNSIRNIRWVKDCNGKQYSNRKTRELIHFLRQRHPELLQ